MRDDNDDCDDNNDDDDVDDNDDNDNNDDNDAFDDDDNDDKLLFYKEVRFQMFCPLVKISCPLAVLNKYRYLITENNVFNLLWNLWYP